VGSDEGDFLHLFGEREDFLVVFEEDDTASTQFSIKCSVFWKVSFSFLCGEVELACVIDELEDSSSSLVEGGLFDETGRKCKFDCRSSMSGLARHFEV